MVTFSSFNFSTVDNTLFAIKDALNCFYSNIHLNVIVTLICRHDTIYNKAIIHVTIH